MKEKIFRDAVHGDITLDELEVRVLDTAPMQRLRAIKQLGTSNLVFPSAVHTRFEHSLGTCWLAKRILDTLVKNGARISSEERRITTLAALLHDITHIPFGHTLEDERRVLPRHDHHPMRYRLFLQDSPVGDLLRGHALMRDVTMLLRCRSYQNLRKPFLGQIVSHTICADLLDYLKRDTYFCGLRTTYDDRIFSYFRINDGQLVVSLLKGKVFRHDALSELLAVLRLRYSLTERVYYHHAKVATGVMLSRMVELALQQGMRAEELFRLGDEGLLLHIEERFGTHPPLRDLLDKFRRRYLYKRCYALTYKLDFVAREELARRFHCNHRNARTRMEQVIARTLRVPDHAVCIYCPPVNMNLKEADVLVQVDDGKPRPLTSLGNLEIRSLQERYGMIWKFYVFLDREYESKLDRAGAVCEKVIGHPDQRTVEKHGQLNLFERLELADAPSPFHHGDKPGD
ncbi:HD domain-containing protein [bacterium]|nr:HD domain-containing protein [candidate division CSSED10-310 bacterium]